MKRKTPHAQKLFIDLVNQRMLETNTFGKRQEYISNEQQVLSAPFDSVGEPYMPAQLLVGLDEIRSRWGWYLVFGISLSVIGIAAIGQSFAASIASITLLGWLVILSGLVQAMLAFRVRIWSGFFLHLMGGVLEIIVGLLIVAAPATAAIAVTLLLAVYLLVSGLFRMIAVLLLRFPGSGWGVLGGLISFLLGLALWQQWPLSGLIFIGTCVGVSLILHGASWISFALNLRKLPVLPAT